MGTVQCNELFKTNLPLALITVYRSGMLIQAIAVGLICLATSPRLGVDSAKHDFGVVSPWKTLIHRFALTNESNQNIRLGPVETSCGCTAVVLDKADLASGEQTSLEASLNPGGRDGELHASVQINVGGPQKEVLLLTLTGQAKAPFRITPPLLDFKVLSRDQPNVQRARVLFNEGVIPNASIQAEVDAELQPFLTIAVLPSGGGTVLEATLDPRSMPLQEDGNAAARIKVNLSGGVEVAPLLVQWTFRRIDSPPPHAGSTRD